MQKKIGKALLLAMLFAALCGSSGFATYKLLSMGRLIEVPDFKGRSLEEARTVSENRGLHVIVEAEEFNQYVPEGYVMSQDMQAGSTLKGGAEIKLVVSKGPLTRLMPFVMGQTLMEAKALLAEKGLEATGVIHVASDLFEEGRVLAQGPGPEERLGDSITLVVSTGPYDVTYYCPPFVGMFKEDAEVLAEELGLIIETEGEGDLVTAQSPEAGSLIKAGAVIKLQMQERTGPDYDEDSPIDTFR